MQAKMARPAVLFSTLEGEQHEIDALMACYLTRASGMYGEFVGPNLPESDLADLATDLQTAAVSISVRTPLEETGAVEKLIEFRRALPDHIQLWITGARAAEVGAVMRDANSVIIENLAILRQELDKLALNLPG